MQGRAVLGGRPGRETLYQRLTLPVAQIHGCPSAEPSPSVGSVSATSQKDSCSRPGSRGRHTSWEGMPFSSLQQLWLLLFPIKRAAATSRFKKWLGRGCGKEWAFSSNP